MPLSDTFWNCLFLAVILASVVVASIGKSQTRIAQKFLSNDAHRPRRLWNIVSWLGSKQDCDAVRRRVISGIAILSCVASTFLVIPLAAETWHGKSLQVFGKPDAPFLFLLHMKDRTSFFHKEIVQLVIPTRDYLIIRLSDQVPYPDVQSGFGNTESNPSVDEQIVSFRTARYSPILIPRDIVEAIIPVLSPGGYKEILGSVLGWSEIDKEPGWEVERTPDGGYVISFNWNPKPVSSSCPAKSVNAEEK
jgi:hypothetical protein